MNPLISLTQITLVDRKILVSRSFNLSSTTNIRSRWVFPSPFNLNICTVNCTTETEGMFWEKAALNPLVSRWIMPFEFSFLWRKDQIYIRHCSKQTSKLSQLQNKKNWIYSQSLSSPFTRSWKCCPRPTASGSISKTSDTIFHHTDLPAGK